MSVFKHGILNQILDGTKKWEPADSTPQALDLFEVEVVFRLRQLRDEGRIEIEEVNSPSPGQKTLIPQLSVLLVLVSAIL